MDLLRFEQAHPTLFAAWAKSDALTGAWMSLPVHLSDTAEVAKLLWDQYTANSVKRVIVNWLENQKHGERDAENLARKLLIFLAAGHDIGKFSAAFVSHVPELNDGLRQAGLRCPNFTAEERRRAHHSTVSATAMTQWLAAKFPEANLRRIRTLACVVAGHHGRFPNNNEMSAARPASKAAGSEAGWQRGRERLFELAQQLAELNDEDLACLAQIGIDQPSQVILTSLVIQSDWIASAAELFPYQQDLLPELRAERGIQLLDLPKPWRPCPPAHDAELFETRFELPPKSKLRPTQAAAMQLARQAPNPGLMLIEAPTGEGKTEAAFAAAEILAAKFGCGGVIVALPTQATSNAMFSRTLRWLNQSATDEGVSVNLIHGNAQFNEEFEQLSKAKFKQIFDAAKEPQMKAGQITAHWWLTGRKKSALADFVVATIDQVLLAALSAKHVVLRHLGLAGKVVILDEIHACDSYMRVYLTRALRWLGALGVPVIALSATLPSNIRQELLTAYEQGRHFLEPAFESKFTMTTGYPVLSSTWSPPVICPASDRRRVTKISQLKPDEDLVEVVLDFCSAGGVIAVVHNTVRAAQHTYSRLRQVLADDVLLIHSRFIASDRLTRENALVQQLGKNGQRPKRLVVVATQVIEQSLDIDFDLMISDFAPMDALIQRIGRLHRHDRSIDERPSKLNEARLLLTGVQDSDDGPVFDNGSQRVYGQEVLLRTKCALDEHLKLNSQICSPDDVAELVEATYREDIAIPSAWSDKWRAATAAQARRIGDQIQRANVGCVAPPEPSGALYGWANLDFDADVSSPSVRDIEESISVIVVVRGKDGRIRTLPWLADFPDEQVDFDAGLPDRLAKATARCATSLPIWMAHGQRGDQLISTLEADFIPGWQQSRWLRGELPLVLDHNLEKHVAGYVIRYDQNLGLTVQEDS